MMSLWDALRMNMMISYQELVRTFLRQYADSSIEFVPLPNEPYCVSFFFLLSFVQILVS